MASNEYVLTVRTRDGRAREHRYASDEPLYVGGTIVFLDSRWIVDRVVEPSADEETPHAFAEPARYRLVLHHENDVDEAGAFRRFREHGPGIGHAFTTVVDGTPVGWEVVEERLARDDGGYAYVELVARRNFAEQDELPSHELEHLRDDGELPPAASEALAGAEQAGARLELVSLDAGTAPDWEEAERYLSTLILEELGVDLLELCGVDLDREPRSTWLAAAQARLLEDLERFREDVEGDHDEIEEWEVRGTRIFASVGRWEDEAAPDQGHGWMTRLVDASALGAAGFHRIRKAELLV